MRVDAEPEPTPLFTDVVEKIQIEASHGGVASRCSVQRGHSLSPGLQRSAFYWRDVVRGPPPRRREKGDALYVTFHATDDTGDVRIHFSTIIHVDPGMDKDSPDDDIIHVEERVNVQRRFLQEWIDRERAFSDRFALRARSRLARSLAAQRRFANTFTTAWVVSLLVWWIRLQAKVGSATIRTTRSLMRSLVVIPEAVLTHTANAGIHLGSRTGRRVLRKAIRDPASATPHEKVLALVVGSLVLAGILFFVAFLNTTFPTPYSGAYSHIQDDFLKSLLGMLALPIPIELLLIDSILKVGASLAFAGLFIGKMVGAWMLYLMGDSLFDGVARKARTSPRLAKFVSWMQRAANRFGFLMLILINAIPFVPDLIIIIFAVSGMRFRSFFWGIAFGSVLKFGGIIAAVYLIGPEQVESFFRRSG